MRFGCGIVWQEGSCIRVIRKIVGIEIIVALLTLSAIYSQAADVPSAASLPIQRIVLMSAAPSLGPLMSFVGDGTAHLAYEIYLSNFGKKPARIVALRVHGSHGASFDMTIEGDPLKASFIALGSGDHLKPQDPVLAPGASGMLFVFLNFGSHQAPSVLDNAMVVEPDGDGDDVQLIPLSSLHVQEPSAASTIDAPLTGARWLAANGPSNTSLHRRAVIVLDGKAKSPERYAIDWIKLGDDGNTFSGDEHRNSSYHAYDVPVAAVADGRVVEALDGIAENIPHSDKLAVEMTPAVMAGNNIVEDIGNGHYVGYAHFRPGTVAVKKGDAIHVGQVLGRLGNSGNSTEPHLHIQICDGPSFLACNGVPMQFKNVMLSKYTIEKKGETPIRLSIEGAPIAITGQEPTEDELVGFPGK